MRRICLIVLLLVASLVLSACEVRVRQSTLVRDDGSGQVGVIVAADEEFRQAVANFGGQEAGNPFIGAAEGLGDEVEWSEYDEDGFLGVQASRAFASLDDYQDAATELSQLAGVEIPFPSIDRDGRRWTYTAEFPEFDAEALGEIGSGTGFDLSTLPLDELFDIEISAKLPGDVVEHNGDEVTDAGQVKWRLGIDSGPLTLQATSETSVLGRWLLIGGGLILLAGVGWLVLRMRRRPGPEPVEPSVVVVPD